MVSTGSGWFESYVLLNLLVMGCDLAWRLSAPFHRRLPEVEGVMWLHLFLSRWVSSVIVAAAAISVHAPA